QAEDGIRDRNVTGVQTCVFRSEGLTLTEISHRLQRTPGSTKDYLSWLEDVDLVTSRQKRYSFSDPLLRVWVRLHCRPSAPTEDRSEERRVGTASGDRGAEQRVR